MTSQMTIRSWNHINRAANIKRSFFRSLYTPTVQRGSFHAGRIRIHGQVWRHRRKEFISTSCTPANAPLHNSQSDAQTHRTSTYVVCNHDLSQLTATADVDSSRLAPCGHCNISGNPFRLPETQVGSYHEHSSHGAFLPPPLSQGAWTRTMTGDGDTDNQDETVKFLGKHHLGYGYSPLHSKKPIHIPHILTSYQSALVTAPHDAYWIVLRAFTTSTRCLEESKSKVEDTVKALKEEAKSKQQPSKVIVADTPTTVVVAKKSLWQRFVAELKHYYHGFRLLSIDVRLCCRYLYNILCGKSLSRRERRQLVRTTADLFRLVPFLVFVIVPFMEFLLPVALKLFPGMLPSTFNEEKKQQETLRKKLKSKLEMAKFLQDTIEEMSLQRKGSDESRVQEFKTFMKRVRSEGEGTTNEEIIKYSKIFKDEITLDSLGRAQLAALCKLLELQPIGTNAFLRFQLRMKLRQLEADDKMIDNEGIDNLAVWELQEACRARGMRSLGVPTNRLKNQLQQWLDLHLVEQVPASLLLLSRALYFPPSVAPEQQLKATISVLPDTMAEEAKVAVSEVAGERVDNKTKLEIIKQEEQAIEEERKESEKEMAQEEEKKKKEAAKLDTSAKEPVEEPAAPIEDVAKVLDIKTEEILVDKATTPVFKEGVAEPAPEVKETVVDTEDQSISKKELEEVEEVLEHVAEERMSMKLEQDELEALKEDVSEYKENLEDLKEVVLATGGEAADVRESKGAHRLSKQVNKIVDQLEGLIDDLQADKEVLTEEIEVGEVRIKRSKELKEDDSMRQEVLDQITEQKANVVSINELLLAMKRIQKVSDDTKFQRIMEVLDEDKDGIIDIDDALKVIELLGRENVKVSASKMSDILELLRKESAIVENKKKEKEANKKVAEVESPEIKVDNPEPKPEEILKDPTDQPKSERKDKSV